MIDTIAPTTTTALLLMGVDEARARVIEFNANMQTAERAVDICRRALLDLYEREGWRSLGYQSWRACAMAELSLSQAQVYRYLGAAQAEQDIAPVLQDSHHENLPEAVLRPLLQLNSPEDRQTAAQLAIGSAGGATPTSGQMREAVEQVKPPQTCGHIIRAGSTKIDGITYCPRCAAQAMAALNERTAVEQASALDEAHALPPAPDGWTIWRNDNDSTIGMRHTSGYKITGSDAAELIADAAACSRPLAELADHDWRMFYDPTCPAHLHAFTAMHETYQTIAAHDLPHLALAAWRARLYEDDLPDVPDSIIDALYLAGYDWRPDSDGWVRHGTRLDGRTPLGELRYLAGLDGPLTTTTPRCEECAAPATDHRTLGGMLAHRCVKHAIQAEVDDLVEQLGPEYIEPSDEPWTDGHYRHKIAWTSGAGGWYTYLDALGMHQSSATRLKREAAPPPPTDPRTAASAWLDSIQPVFKQAAPGTMFRMSEMREAAQHVAALLAAAAPDPAMGAAVRIATPDDAFERIATSDERIRNE